MIKWHKVDFWLALSLADCRTKHNVPTGALKIDPFLSMCARPASSNTLKIWLIRHLTHPFSFFSTSLNGSTQHDSRMVSALPPLPPPANLFSLTRSILPSTIDPTYRCEGGCGEATGLQHPEHGVALSPRPGHQNHQQQTQRHMNAGNNRWR